MENEELFSAASRTTTTGIDEYDSNTRRITAEQGVNRAAAASPPPLLDFNVPLGGGSSGKKSSGLKNGAGGGVSKSNSGDSGGSGAREGRVSKQELRKQRQN